MLKLKYDRHLFLSCDPVITAYLGSFNYHPDSITPDFPEGIKADIILEHVSWNLSSFGIQTIKQRYESWQGVSGRMLIVNTENEASLIDQIGVPGFQCTHDIYLPDYDFLPCDTPVEYDALYTARLASFKRHHLLRKLNNVRILTGGVGEVDAVNEDLENVDPSNSIYHDYLKDKSVCFEKLDTFQVSAEINKSCCCLALSAEEGQMSSSSEYLLCGKPVVSTHSVGGRDIFYDKYNSTIINDNEDDVVKAVQYWVENPPDSHQIRRNYLKQLNAFRYYYCRRISQMQQDAGGHPEHPEKIFHDLFLDKNSYQRRLLDGSSKISRNEFIRRVSYPETEIMFRPSSQLLVTPSSAGYLIDDNDFSIKLDELSSWIFKQLDGRTTITSISRELTDVYGDFNRISSGVRDTIARFILLGVIEIANHPV